MLPSKILRKYVYFFITKQRNFHSYLEHHCPTTFIEKHFWILCEPRFSIRPSSHDILSENFTILANMSTKVLFFLFSNSQVNGGTHTVDNFLFRYFLSGSLEKLNLSPTQ
jgi:hypothetical protein